MKTATAASETDAAVLGSQKHRVQQQIVLRAAELMSEV
jgi:hypothetical protein